MGQLRNGLQLILQTETSPGWIQCEGFFGLPIVQPGYIAIVPVDSAVARRNADRLARELRREILAVPGGQALAGPQMPCGVRFPGGPACHALNVPSCSKVLVAVGDATTLIDPSHPAEGWLRPGEPFHVLPAFPPGADPYALLPSSLQHVEAMRWRGSVVELIPHILVLVGLVPSEFRIFISYRSGETRELAEQLFEALTKANFDIFVDRFRLPPGADFQRRLREELAHKSMVLVLESAGILDSRWTRFEVQFAKTERLGLLGLHLPGGTRVPDIDPGRRLRLRAGDLVHSSGPLTSQALDRVVQRVQQEHSRALFRRRKAIRDAMQDALRFCGVPDKDQELGADGVLCVQSPAKSHQYSVLLTSRPPELEDFHLLGSRQPARRSTQVMVGPAAYLQEAGRARMEWLARVSRIRTFDEGQLLQVAGAMAQGSLQ